MKTSKSSLQRFLDKTMASEAGCIEWTAAKNPSGYGRFKAVPGQTSMVLAHRWAYEHFVGAIPAGLVIDHLCRNRACVNPDHLEPVTQQENVRRGAGHGKEIACPLGHPYVGNNLYIRPSGGRSCRECNRRRAAINFQKRKGV